METGPVAISFGGKEATYLANFMMELGSTPFNSVRVTCSSTGALRVAGKSTYSLRTKYIGLWFFFLHELTKSSQIVTHPVPT